MLFTTWNIDASQILSRRELAAVLKDLKRRAGRLPNVQMNLAVVRLAIACDGAQQVIHLFANGCLA